VLSTHTKNTHTWSVSQAMASALPVTIQARTYFHAAWTSKKDEIVLVWPSSMPPTDKRAHGALHARFGHNAQKAHAQMNTFAGAINSHK